MIPAAANNGRQWTTSSQSNVVATSLPSIPTCNNPTAKTQDDGTTTSGDDRHVNKSLINAAEILKRLHKMCLNLDFNAFTLSSIWPAFTSYLKEQVAVCIDFVKKLPGFGSLPNVDSPLLFKKSFLQICLLQSTIMKPPRFFGFSPQSEAVFFYFFPNHRDIIAAWADLASTVAHLRITALEIAALNGLLFYHQLTEAPIISRPEIISKLNETIAADLHMALLANGIDPKNRWPQLSTIRNGLNQVHQRFAELARFVAKKHPEHFYSDKLCVELFG